jgi:hypothetical protein
MATKVSTPADNDSELIREVRLMRAQLDGLAEENAALRAEVARVKHAAHVPEPVVQRSTHQGGNWEDMYPAHDPDFVAAFTRYGTGSPEAKTALAEANRRIAARADATPGRQSDFERADKNRNASMDLAGVPLAPGFISRDPETGQLHIITSGQSAVPPDPKDLSTFDTIDPDAAPRPGLTCPTGHPASPGAKFCTVCGGPVASPSLGEDWSQLDPAPPDQSLAARRRIEEG